MKIIKQSQGGRQAPLEREDLALISALARREMKEEEVYTFSVRLCDNEVDRDLERFSPETLEELAGMFVGKSGIFDHQWSARGQAARIYKAQVIHQPQRRTRAGDGYCWLKGYAYMLRTKSNQDLIAEIEGGIKKEVSVGCAVERTVCSICGQDLRQGQCGHKKGELYDGKLCFVSLEGASDAYEFSFVAVPAQPLAGVVKGAAREWTDLKSMARGNRACLEQLEQLEEEARLGRRYLEETRREVVRLGLLAGLGVSRDALKTMADKLSPEELELLREGYARQAEKRYPLKTQLDYGSAPKTGGEESGAFLV